MNVKFSLSNVYVILLMETTDIELKDKEVINCNCYMVIIIDKIEKQRFI
jgi:hypothetical protein